MNQKVRINSNLQFDDITEKDIIIFLDRLKENHKLGEFAEKCIRFCYENQDKIKGMGFNLNSYDISECRQNYFKYIETIVDRLREKVDKIYDMAYKTYSLNLIGKEIGAEEKAEKFLGASFILEQQVAEIEKTLGMDKLQIWESNVDKLSSIGERASELVEFTLTKYKDILTVPEVRKESERASVSQYNSIVDTTNNAQMQDLENQLKIMQQQIKTLQASVRRDINIESVVSEAVSKQLSNMNLSAVQTNSYTEQNDSRNIDVTSENKGNGSLSAENTESIENKEVEFSSDAELDMLKAFCGM